MNPSKRERHSRSKPETTKLRVRDFLQREGVQLESPDDKLSPEDTLIEGRFIHQELRNGLFLHVSDALERRPFTATSQLSAGLSCIFFLDGAVDMRMGDRPFHFDGARMGAVEGTAIMNARPESFQRSSFGGQRLRHLVVTASPEWLDMDGLEDSEAGTKLFSNHLASQRWTVTPRAIELLHQIVAPTNLAPCLRKLFLESRAVEIIAEALSAITQSPSSNSSSRLSTRQDGVRLTRAKEFIATNLAASLNVPTIARAAGINVSGLQHLFRLHEGSSVFEYIRKARLENAYEALASGEVGVSSASSLAGYSTPENFATAFRRQFNITPKHLIKRR